MFGFVLGGLTSAACLVLLSIAAGSAMVNGLLPETWSLAVSGVGAAIAAFCGGLVSQCCSARQKMLQTALGSGLFVLLLIVGHACLGTGGWSLLPACPAIALGFAASVLVLGKKPAPRHRRYK